MNRPKKYTYFIGIDVSRNKLDFAIMRVAELLFHKEIKNEVTEIKGLVLELKKLPKFVISKAVFGLEHTGVYGNHLLLVLKKLKANIVYENPVHIRNSLGNIRGKYDKIDAIRIAQYLYKNREQFKLWQPKRPVVQELAHLSALRNKLITLGKSLNTPLNEDALFVNKRIITQSKALCSDSFYALTTDLEKVDNTIAGLIKSDDNLNRLHRLITSVPSVGTVTAVQIIITTNEFQDINNPKKFACYAGVVPFKNDSGKIEGRSKLSNIANKRVKTLLHTCALGAMRYVPDLKAYYVQKTKTEGKPKMAVLNAIRNKLVHRIFACVNDNRLYQSDYQRANEGT
ncbi:IS110 family transposase [Mucilaginibacter jinjuensis]|uniref:IS110 family transposase n=1 Tax=Mucilaginibacter jinjuensis TaxID=1176721 RepID=A0ABY7TDI5_9SPHI|nr:IS110 family transposase [Mucilaginibacter jinjuensis]WCT14432.1 IS110 family transposase [Mucilaginibacter jinjuensis]